MSTETRTLRFPWKNSGFLLLLALMHYLVIPGSTLTTDGGLLLSFKYSILSDPKLVLENWNYDDQTPCNWNGVTCMEIKETNESSRVVSLSLPNSDLLGSISADIGLIDHLRYLDLSNNSLNGTLPNTIFNASQLRVLSISNNEISGSLPEFVGNLQALEFLNLSDNALTGKIPYSLTTLSNLTSLSLSNNYFLGQIPTGFKQVQTLDLSSNLINGSLPSDFGGLNLRYLNLSYNSLSGEVSPDFGSKFPTNVIIDLSFNNLTGEIPLVGALFRQKMESFMGNLNLCGKPLKNPCPIPSTLSTPPNISTVTTATSSPAIAAIPKSLDENPSEASSNAIQNEKQSGLRPAAIVGVIVGDLAGIGLLFIVFLFLYQARKKSRGETKECVQRKEEKTEYSSPSDSGTIGWSCLGKKGGSDEEISESTSSESDEDKVEVEKKETQNVEEKNGSLVTVDGETELELDTLLKASAYILGSTGSSIMYKAVLEDGTTFAVRRIGENGVERLRDFENQVRLIAKLRHPNLIRIRGFYWGEDEKLVIYDYAQNGSLANATYNRKHGSSPYHLPWETRLRVARGVARGLSYLHDKKFVHGNLKPSNILLGPDMEPRIGDFGLDRLVWGDYSSKASGSARYFGSKRSTLSRESLQDQPPATSPTCSGYCSTPYQAPESLKNIKPNPKWDVYSFGVVLLELLSGRVFTEAELSGFPAEDSNRVLRMADVGLRADVDERDESLLACFKLGFGCASLTPQKRPSMKEALQVLEKLPSYSIFSVSHSNF